MFSTPYIAGKTIDVPPSALSEVFNPANQRPFARIFMAKAEHMRAAIDAADAAKASWAATPPAERERRKDPALQPLFYRPKGAGRPTKKDRRTLGKIGGLF